MPKRFTDTDIWEEDWYLAMPVEYMKLWDYIKDRCDHAGIWKPNKTKFELTTKTTVDLKKALQYFNSDKERIRMLPNGRWLLLDFICFQYGYVLNPNNRVHFSILQILKKNGVKLTSIRGLIDLKDRVKDKDKDKDKDKEREKKRYGDFVTLKSAEYQKLIKEYGKAVITQYITRLNNYIGSKGKQYKSHYHTILTWMHKDEEKKPPQAGRGDATTVKEILAKKPKEEDTFKGTKI